MVDVLLLGDDPATPPALAAGHRVTHAPLTLAAVDAPGDVLAVDARRDPMTARRLLPLLRTRPVVLLVDDTTAPLVDPAWQADDVLHESAGCAEVDLRLRLLVAPASELREGSVVVDEAGYRASVSGRALDLTYTEFELLRFLVANPGRVHSRDHLLAEVWGRDYYGGSRTVDVHVRRLRAKLGPEHDALIETVRNVGYRFAAR